ncbi:hypothetical protein N3C_0800 [Clostridium sp. N3C]|uniref:hypothetical protein n=1 Tax=Clostridium sp. N3C TaxID=1776758 RepID=UPI00092E095C|nr:hypothetical protein [Clostridium sp. N3C]SCN22459.1 hypothetical protein N3C_0800 [Clostridium sp. N3C]
MNDNVNSKQNSTTYFDYFSVADIVKEAICELKKKESDIVTKLRDYEPSIAYEALLQVLEARRGKVVLIDKDKNSLEIAENKFGTIVNNLKHTVNKIIDTVEKDEKVNMIGRINDVIAYNIDFNMLKKARDTFITVPVIVQNKLIENEYIIFRSDNAEFNIPNKSLIGNHTLFISNKGRVIVYNSGGDFGGEAVYITIYPIEVSFSGGIDFKSDINEEFSYNYKISINDFFQLLKKIDKKCFSVDDYYGKKIIKIDGNSYFISNITIDKDKIIVENLNNHNIEINYKHIQEYEYCNGLLNIKGYFSFKNDVEERYCKEISLFIPNESKLENLRSFFYNRNNLTSIIPEESEVLFGRLTGYVNDILYNKKDIAIVKKENIINFVNIDSLRKIYGFSLENVSYYIENNTIFIIQDKNIFLLNLAEEYNDKFGLSEKTNFDSNLYRFGYTDEGYPFIINISSEGVEFKQSANRNFLYLENTQIKDITVKEFIDSSEFVKINITKIDNENFTFYLYGKNVNELVKKTFKNSKLKLYNSLKVEDLFTSWARQINDILNYYYFGSLFCVKEELDKLLEEKSSNLDYEDKLKAVNILYYAVQEQKKQLDIVGIYLPKLLENNERELMKKLGRNISSMPFKGLQKQLLSIASQILRSLNEIERTLAHIPYAIYPNTNTRFATINSRYRQAGAQGLVGAAGAIFTGAFSLMGILNSAVNILNTYKMDKELEKVEKNKVDIYTYQAIDYFKHIMQIMIPYYIDEVNQALFYTFKQISQYYVNLNDSSEVKMELIHRISDLYTMKQLPISDLMVKPKKYLIEQIQSSINVNMAEINNNLLKGGGENV